MLAIVSSRSWRIGAAIGHERQFSVYRFQSTCSVAIFWTMVVSRILPLGRLTNILSPWKRTGTEAPGPNSPGKVAVGGFRDVFADILGAVDFDDDGSPAGWGFGGFAQDFLFGLRPVFHIAARDSSVADVDFFGAAPNGLVPVAGTLGQGVGSFGAAFMRLMPPAMNDRRILV